MDISTVTANRLSGLLKTQLSAHSSEYPSQAMPVGFWDGKLRKAAIQADQKLGEYPNWGDQIFRPRKWMSISPPNSARLADPHKRQDTATASLSATFQITLPTDVLSVSSLT